jgi:hypothetical protein
MASLSGPYQIDRVGPLPVFYTPQRKCPPHDCVPGKTVLAASGDHSRPGFVNMGYVNRQTPFGQGIGMGMEAKSLRRATSQEIRRALATVHPHGDQFRPGCEELDGAGFALMMSGPTAPKGWTVDRSYPGSRPVVPLTRAQIERIGLRAQQRYRQILADWGVITQRQIAAILENLS